MANPPPSVNLGVSTQNSAARIFWSRLSETSRAALSKRRPWFELLDRSSFAKPESFGEATSRIRKNWGYFRINYVVFLLAVVALSLVLHPISLFLLCVLLGAWMFLYLYRTEQLVLFGRQYSEREVLAIMTVLTIVVVFLTNVGSLLISALMIGAFLVSLHGAFKVPDDLFLDDQESAGGFLSFLSGPGSAQPSVSSLV
ncbi:hypothetical protein KP509_36G034000 [Ceratopteris richardii]|uniref:PRA1 family protein n=1 Tax=Ceratopteris richardii TaxID=49495 RepID=A0A8T2QC38_CERRI|nr:hypothetical protein KP509_36G034000 [Ceratopteris richardii]